MKLVEGRTLEQVLDRAEEDLLAPTTLRGHLQVFLKVCEAVAFYVGDTPGDAVLGIPSLYCFSPDFADELLTPLREAA